MDETKKPTFNKFLYQNVPKFNDLAIGLTHDDVCPGREIDILTINHAVQ